MGEYTPAIGCKCLDSHDNPWIIDISTPRKYVVTYTQQSYHQPFPGAVPISSSDEELTVVPYEFLKIWLIKKLQKCSALG